MNVEKREMGIGRDEGGRASPKGMSQNAVVENSRF